jgi:uncharacterized membrane protein YidH (DUF202 family)
MMTFDEFKRELAREAREYLADVRTILQGLRSAEGLFTLGLVIASLAITGAWALFSLGFSPPNEHVSRLIYSLGMRVCRPITNLAGVIIFINLFLLLFLSVVSLGNAMNVITRVRQGQPRELRDLIISSVMMLVTGVGGIVYMVAIC